MIAKTIPIIKYRIWGGEKLHEYGKQFTGIAGESWELSFLQGEQSTTEKGKLCDVVSDKDLGGYDKENFPLLIKLIDAKENLSVQVHPTDGYALSHGLKSGKSEAWYVLSAEKGGCIYVGLKEDTSKEALTYAIKSGNVLDKLNRFEVKQGEVYYIPSGTIHAIGKGVTVYEIQQSSDTTYRVYDYDRADKDGKKRELHLHEATECALTSKYERQSKKTDGCILSCPYFDLSEGNKSATFITHGVGAITIIDGDGMVNGQKAIKGDTFFVSSGETVAVKINGKYIFGESK